MMVDPPTFNPLAASPATRPRAAASGKASFILGENLLGAAEFLLPSGGQAVIAFQAPADLTAQDFGRDLVIDGTAGARQFRIECAQIYVRNASRFDKDSSRSLISPVNGPVRITYGTTRPASRALALLNNFDFSDGDVMTDGQGATRSTRRWP